MNGPLLPPWFRLAFDLLFPTISIPFICYMLWGSSDRSRLHALVDEGYRDRAVLHRMAAESIADRDRLGVMIESTKRDCIRMRIRIDALEARLAPSDPEPSR